MKKGYIFYLAISISASSTIPIADTALMSWQDKVHLIPDPTNSDIRVLSHRKVQRCTEHVKRVSENNLTGFSTRCSLFYSNTAVS